VRRYYYSEAIVDYPDTVRPMFANDLAPAERQTLEENWPIVCRLMTGAMDLGPEQRKDSRAIVAAELDWLDGLLADGRRHLVGDRFSRVDVTAASLLAPLALPKEHPTYALLALPPLAAADIELWGERPVANWVREIYRNHRGG
jgi:glutathione S-transferase